MSGVIRKFCAMLAIFATVMATRYFTMRRKKIMLWKRVGCVTELAIFPLLQGQKIKLSKAYCTKFGLKSTANMRDGCFVIYDSRSTKLLPKANYFFETIKINYNLGKFDLEAPQFRSLSISMEELDIWFTMVEILTGEVIPVRDCGDYAADWVTRILLSGSKKLRLGYYNMDFANNSYLTSTYQTFLDSIRLFTRNAVNIHTELTNPLLINEDSIMGIATTMETFLDPYGFNANIVIRTRTSYPLEEYTWKKVKIGNVEFDCIKPCEDCLTSRGTIYDNSSNDPINMKKFMFVLKTALQKYANFKIKDTPFMGITLKLTGDPGMIKSNDEVFAWC